MSKYNEPLTDTQAEIVMQAVMITRNHQINKISDLQENLFEMGHSKEDVNAALVYWANKEKAFREAESVSERQYKSR